MKGEYGKMTPFKTAVKWLVWKPLFALSHKVLYPLSVIFNDAMQEAHHQLLNKATEGECPF